MLPGVSDFVCCRKKRRKKGERKRSEICKKMMEKIDRKETKKEKCVDGKRKKEDLVLTATL